MGRDGSRSRIHASSAPKLSPTQLSFAIDQTTTLGRFLSRSTMRRARSSIAGSHRESAGGLPSHPA